MTKILLHFLTTTGIPLSLAECEIRLTRSDYTEVLSGVLMPRLVKAQLDAEGKAQIELWPCDTKYHITVYDPVSAVALHHDFYVPVATNPADVFDLQDLIVASDTIISENYDEAAYLQILLAKAEAISAKNAAQASAVAAAASAVLANQSISDITDARDDAVTAAAAALVSQGASATSASNAYIDAQLANDRAGAALLAKNDAVTAAGTATTKAGEASTSATNASGSATAANQSKIDAAASSGTATGAATTAITQAGIATTKAGEASGSATTATTQAGIATTKAGEASGSATTATTQAGISTTKAGEANTSATNAAGSATAANNSKIAAGTSETNASGFATTASGAATTATTQAGIATTKAGEASGSATTAGTAATTATTQAGIATTKAEEADASADAAAISAAEAAQSAQEASAGQINSDWNAVSGVAQILNKPVIPSTKADLGLGNVDNTSDANKPVSTAQAAINALKAPLASPAFTGTPTGITKTHVGLGNVDNTSDVSKPVSTAQQAALDAKAPLTSPAFTGTPTGITKAHVGLGNVDNTADTAKPVSTAQQAALDAKAPLASPAFTGTPTGITKAHVGLSNVDNTSDANKPVSTAQAAADALKANIVTPTFSGLLTADSIVSNGAVGVGGGVSSSQSLRVTKAITGGTVAMGVQSDGTIQSDVTAIAVGVNTNMKTVAASFTLANLYHFYASQSALGAGSTVTNQYGYAVDASLVGGANNYAFYGNIPAAAARWNLYMAGTASNYLSGKLLVGSNTDNGDKLQITGATSLLGNVGIGFQGAGNLSLSINRNITGATTAFGVRQSGIIQTDVTAEVMSFASYSNTVAGAFTLPDFEHFFVGQGTLGAGSAITRQSGLYVASNMTGAANNYGVNLNLAAGTNRWNVYAPGTASNYLAGKLLIGVGVGDNGEQLQVLGATRLAGALTVTGTVTGVTKTHVGLGNVDNTSDADKPISTATQTALDLKAPQGTTYTKAEIDALILAGGSGSGFEPGDTLTTARNLIVPDWIPTDGGLYLKATYPALAAEIGQLNATANKLTNPATLPVGFNGDEQQGVSYSPDGTLMAITHFSSPFVSMYSRSGTVFTKLANPATLPAGTPKNCVFTSDGLYLIVVHATSPFFTIYAVTGSGASATFTKVANPASLPSSTTEVAVSADNKFIAFSCINTPYVHIYQRNGTSFDKLANPAVLPPSSTSGIAFSPNSGLLVLGHNSSPWITTYSISGSTFTKLGNPATLPSMQPSRIAFSPDGTGMAMTMASTPFVNLYNVNGSTFTKLSNPASLPTGKGFSVDYSPDSSKLVVGHAVTPFMSIYSKIGDVYTKQTNPASLPTAAVIGSDFSPSGYYLTCALGSTPYIETYGPTYDAETLFQVPLIAALPDQGLATFIKT